MPLRNLYYFDLFKHLSLIFLYRKDLINFIFLEYFFFHNIYELFSDIIVSFFLYKKLLENLWLFANANDYKNGSLILLNFNRWHVMPVYCLLQSLFSILRKIFD